MINYAFKPTFPDGEDSMCVARNMMSKHGILRNDLEEFLNRQLDTSLMKKINFNQIEDFPKLKRRHLVKSVFQGSYQLRQCRSYLKDLIANGHAFTPASQLLKQVTISEMKEDLLQGITKLIAVEVTSRHRRGEYRKQNDQVYSEPTDQKKTPKLFKTTYKVFVEYVPFLNHHSGIKSRSKT